ncbi:hypothetical protein [Opitutus terrae]|uniref:Uncharacterized protein n=1 Tax=Opitutus terrae (strain DSM 11246 / JCM 15787 / PB90-1) TaxID=452637 RepID=B1ZSZ5_OPITP|nr:hypothetical protein [Opitutus terrae]ACB75784.1 hypothetical protein Oter_2502 [Opitutus terrae PB90-1]
MNHLFVAGDPLLELEQQIARRADELARERNGGTRYPLINWLEAEWEVLRHHACYAGMSSAGTDATR